jgi:hypothetical protein
VKDLWRWENSDGVGPYAAYKSDPYGTNHLSRMHTRHTMGDHPHWLTDILEKHELGWVDKNDYRCGCPSRKKLDAWFGGFETLLRQEGFSISLYKVPDRLYLNSFSRKQAAANINGLIPTWRG